MTKFVFALTSFFSLISIVLTIIWAKTLKTNSYYFQLTIFTIIYWFLILLYYLAKGGGGGIFDEFFVPFAGIPYWISLLILLLIIKIF